VNLKSKFNELKLGSRDYGQFRHFGLRNNFYSTDNASVGNALIIRLN
jgi:hypothetical protein